MYPIIRSECIGVLRVDSPLVITDPCYIKVEDGETAPSPGLSSAISYDAPSPGLYPVWIEVADAGEFGHRVSELRLEFRPGGVGSFIDLGILGVDSGQMCITTRAALASSWIEVPDEDQRAAFSQGAPEGMHPWEHFCSQHAGEMSYPGVCNATNNGLGGAVGDVLVACSSGFGDGTYHAYAKASTAGIEGIAVRFLEEDDEDDEADDD